MEIDGLARVAGPAASSSVDAASSSQGADVDYQAFLRLLIAQLQNQDPLNPVESTEYMSQLAAFSNVEQAVETNAKLDQLLSLAQLTQSEALIGRTIVAADGSASGTVVAISLLSNSSEAVLDNGERVRIEPGIEIR